MKNAGYILVSGLLLLGLSGCSTDVSNYAFQTDANQRVGLALPDKTQVRVNAGAALDYDAENFDREVVLEGEAFFQIPNNSESFTIKTANGNVFVPRAAEVNVWSRGDLIEVSVFGGSAELRSKSNKKLKVVTMGKAVRAIKKKVDKDWTVEAPGKPSWVRGKSEFFNLPFKYVIREMEAQFGISIDPNNVNTEEEFSGAFLGADLNTALSMVFSDRGIQYELIENSKFRLIQ